MDLADVESGPRSQIHESVLSKFNTSRSKGQISLHKSRLSIDDRCQNSSDLSLLSQVHLPAIKSGGSSIHSLETLNRHITISKMKGKINSKALSPSQSRKLMMQSQIYGAEMSALATTSEYERNTYFDEKFKSLIETLGVQDKYVVKPTQISDKNMSHMVKVGSRQYISQNGAPSQEIETSDYPGFGGAKTIFLQNKIDKNWTKEAAKIDKRNSIDFPGKPINSNGLSKTYIGSSQASLGPQQERLYTIELKEEPRLLCEPRKNQRRVTMRKKKIKLKPALDQGDQVDISSELRGLPDSATGRSSYFSEATFKQNMRHVQGLANVSDQTFDERQRLKTDLHRDLEKQLHQMTERVKIESEISAHRNVNFSIKMKQLQQMDTLMVNSIKEKQKRRRKIITMRKQKRYDVDFRDPSPKFTVRRMKQIIEKTQNKYDTTAAAGLELSYQERQAVSSLYSRISEGNDEF